MGPDLNARLASDGSGKGNLRKDCTCHASASIVCAKVMSPDAS